MLDWGNIYNKDVSSLTALDNNEILFIKDIFNNNDTKKIFIEREKTIKINLLVKENLSPFGTYSLYLMKIIFMRNMIIETIIFIEVINKLAWIKLLKLTKKLRTSIV